MPQNSPLQQGKNSKFYVLYILARLHKILKHYEKIKKTS